MDTQWLKSFFVIEKSLNSVQKWVHRRRQSNQQINRNTYILLVFF